MLNIASNLQLPGESVTSTIVIYGGKGMGKTNFGNVFAEELYRNHARFSVIDPMGVWWGLQHGRTKDQSGIEVLILGGIHGDLPIEPTAGSIVADLVADESISVIIDISRTSSGKAWSKGEKIRFVTSYMIRLYERQIERRIPIMQIIDEAARFAPQTFVAGDKDVAHCLGAIETIAEEGRNIGIGLTLITLRSARLNKAVAELADMLVAFRVVGPNSVDAVMDWFGSHIPKERHKILVEQLRELPIGTALIVSPGWLKVESSANIRLRETFDSSATPKIGVNLKAPGKAKKPDLDKYRSLMAETIEKAQSSDPKILHKEIDRLKKELIKAESKVSIPGPAPDPIRIPVIDLESLRELETAIVDLELQFSSVLANCKNVDFRPSFDLIKGLKSKQPITLPDPGRILPPNPIRSDHIRQDKKGRMDISPGYQKKLDDAAARIISSDNGDLSPLHRSMLNGMALLHHIGEPNPTMAQVGAIIGKSHKSGRIRGAFNYTRDSGYSEIEGYHIRLTDAGHRESIIPNITSRADIHDLWFQRLTGNELAFLRELIKIYPSGKSLTELGQAIGKDMRSGRIRGALNSLIDKGLAIIEQDHAAASNLLFPEGLR